MGFFDGPNRYAYTHNDPLGFKDPYGLFSFSELFESVVNIGLKVVGALCTAGLELSQFLHDQMTYLKEVTSEVEGIAAQFVGETIFLVAGYYGEETSHGTIGAGEVDDKIRITYINGILNHRSDCILAADAISMAHGGCNVHFIHSATAGFTWDLMKGLLSKTGYVSSQATLLAHQWKGMIEEMGGVEGGGKIIHFAHSMGGTDTWVAKTLLTPEECQMIEVVTFGSASLIGEDEFAQVTHYVSRRDGIPMTDPYAYFRSLFYEESHVMWVGSAQGIPFIDHMFTSPNYQQVLNSLGEAFVETYGVIH
jgi:hypothetical protein